MTAFDVDLKFCCPHLETKCHPFHVHVDKVSLVLQFVECRCCIFLLLHADLFMITGMMKIERNLFNFLIERISLFI